MSSKCSPVVGSSSTYIVWPVARRCSSAASLTRWASPPDKRGRGLAEADVAEADVDERLAGAGGWRGRGRRTPRPPRSACRGPRRWSCPCSGPARVSVLYRAPWQTSHGHVDVGQELHLDLEGAVAGAGLAPAALDVEGEPARLVAADLRLGGRREQLADMVEHPGVGGRVRPRGAPDRALVDVHHLVQLLDAGDPGVQAGDRPRAVELAGQRLVQDVVDQRGLTRPRHPGHRDQAAERERHIHPTQVVLAPRPRP